MNIPRAFCFSLSAILGLLSGCAPYHAGDPASRPVTEMRTDERGFLAGADIEAQDIATVAHKMAREILSTPEIANAKGVPRIVLLPLKNDSRFPINREIFLERIMVLLNEKSAGKVRFLARDRMAELERERDLKQSGQVTRNADPHVNQFRGADFMLTGKLTGTSTRASAGTSDYVLYSFTLIDPNTSDIVCQKSHEIKKQGLLDAVYR